MSRVWDGTLERPCIWIYCNNKALHVSNTYGFAVCSLSCLDMYNENKKMGVFLWSICVSLMRQIFTEWVRNGSTSYLLPIINAELLSRQAQFPIHLQRTMASHLRKSMRLLYRMKDGRKSDYYKSWWNHGLGRLSKFFGKTKVLEAYMYYLYDLMAAIYYREDHDVLFNTLVNTSQKMALLYDRYRDEETVNKLVSY
jgi:hypothetical protein